MITEQKKVPPRSAIKAVTFQHEDSREDVRILGLKAIVSRYENHRQVVEMITISSAIHGNLSERDRGKIVIELKDVFAKLDDIVEPFARSFTLVSLLVEGECESSCARYKLTFVSDPDKD